MGDSILKLLGNCRKTSTHRTLSWIPDRITNLAYLIMKMGSIRIRTAAFMKQAQTKPQMFSGAWKRGRIISQGRMSCLSMWGNLSLLYSRRRRKKKRSCLRRAQRLLIWKNCRRNRTLRNTVWLKTGCSLQWRKQTYIWMIFHRSRWMLSMKLLKKVWTLCLCWTRSSLRSRCSWLLTWWSGWQPMNRLHLGMRSIYWQATWWIRRKSTISAKTAGSP